MEIVSLFGKIKKYLIIAGILLGVGGIVTAGVFIKKYSDSQKLLKDPNKAGQEEAQALVATISKFMVLPDNETPSVANVLDAEKLRSQPFFAKAENGDKTLIYSENKLAILYRPKDNKIINVGGINLEGTSAQTPKLSILNGTTVAGLATQTETQLKTEYPDYLVVKKADAAVKTYIKTIVVDINGKYPAESAKLAASLDGQVGPLPEGETVPVTDPATDILVILGNPSAALGASPAPAPVTPY